VKPLFRKLVYVVAAAMVLFAALVLWVDGHLPASVPTDAPAYAMGDLVDAYRCIDARGQIDLAELKKRHVSLETFVASMAATSPDTKPEAFPTVEARLAFWLNAYHALALRELMDTRSKTTSGWNDLFDAVPIGGKRWTRAAIYRRALAESGDARVFLSIFTGAKGRGVLDGAPFDGDSLNPQLDDAMRRFVRRKDHFAIDGTTVKVSELFHRHQAEFLAALPEERKNVLQIVWAYLPESCEGAAPCDTRGDLDRTCGNRFDQCKVEYLPIDESLAVKN
jgi:Protein of unknown function, DUF547